MPRYCFDVDDGGQKIADRKWSDLSDLEQVREEAINIALEFAREGLPDGDQRAILCKVRDDAGALVLTVSLSLYAEWNNGQKGLGT